MQSILVFSPTTSLPSPPPKMQSILVSGKPHLGTDRLVKILKGFRQHLEARGAEVRFGCEVEDLLLEGGQVAGVRLAGRHTGHTGHVGTLARCVFCSGEARAWVRCGGAVAGG